MAQQPSPAEFIEKWKPVTLSERAASQEHFIDLCRLLGQPTPAEHDATGAEYAFEKGVVPSGGASRGAAGDYGFADVWWHGKFAWEYKRKGKYRDLTEAYRQLCQYREALRNPPLLIVSDITRTEIHTNFTGTAKEVHTVELDNLADPESLDLLRRVFTDPESFKPKKTTEIITKEVAAQFSTIAKSLRQFGHDPQLAAHFLMKCMFCLFAEDVDLLPKALFKNLIDRYKKDPGKLAERMTELFNKMRTGGDYGSDPIKHFNGGLFDAAPALKLTAHDIEKMLIAASSDWGSVEPAIFGTLFERSLDPNTRAQIGAHYTSRDDIMLIVEPVVMAPLRREWEAVKTDVESQIAKRRAAKVKGTKTKADKAIEDALGAFVQKLSTLRILDPACGSGNFLYVAIQQLLQLEKEVITFGARPEIAVSFFPHVRPTQLHGIEINPYAAELAQVVIWIGYLQWMRDNGYIDGIRTPILEPLQTIENRDAILDLSDKRLAKPATWPDADFIIGNPPFLGSRFFRSQGISDQSVETLFNIFDIPNASDLCCYWFELAQQIVARMPAVRVGLLATQGIRGGASRTVLEQIVRASTIFCAHSDRDWVLDGANVHVSIICFTGKHTEPCVLNDVLVASINSDLTSAADLTTARRLDCQAEICSRGSQKRGAFDIDWQIARKLLAQPNPHGRPNSDVIFRWSNGRDIAGNGRGFWIIDFGVDTPRDRACQYEAPFEYVLAKVHPERKENNDARLRDGWWLHGIMQPAMRERLFALDRVCVSPRVAKHRLFTWISNPTLPDDQLIVFGRSDDYFLGALHNSLHELWARRTGTQLREAESGCRYTPTTCFETFPLPWPPGKEPAKHPAYKRTSEAAKQLNEQRERWLNPPEWIEPIAKAVDRDDDFADVPEEARALIRQSAIMARAAKDAKLKKRTLTNLYNERPTWLRLAHEQLDRAVLAAYSATDPEGEWSEDWALVWTDTGAGQPLPPGHELTELRKETDQRVLANLLRMNLERAKST